MFFEREMIFLLRLTRKAALNWTAFRVVLYVFPLFSDGDEKSLSLT